jgi:hypothetical protein
MDAGGRTGSYYDEYRKATVPYVEAAEFALGSRRARPQADRRPPGVHRQAPDERPRRATPTAACPIITAIRRQKTRLVLR